jgi:hypothetical protein
MAGDGFTNCLGPTSRCVSTEKLSKIKYLIVDNFSFYINDIQSGSA